RVELTQNFGWLIDLKASKNKIVIGPKDAPNFVKFLYESSEKPPTNLPEDLQWKELRLPVRAKLAMLHDLEISPSKIFAKLIYIYGEHEVGETEPFRDYLIDETTQEIIIRNPDDERALSEVLKELDFESGSFAGYDYILDIERIVETA